jgi:hypothetical protein
LVGNFWLMMCFMFEMVPRHRLVPLIVWRQMLVRLFSVCFSATAVICSAVHASDLQESTNQAAAEAKRDLCIAINRGADESDLAENFFAYYEGKRVAARFLNPATFSIGQVGPLPRFEVRQVQGPTKMLVAIDSGMFLVDKVPTTDVADGQNVQLRDWFYVRETETYVTVAGGTKTVYVLEPSSKDRHSGVKASRVFPWYNKNDEVVVQGEFKRIEGKKAVFSVNRQESSYALTKFTPGDQKLLRMLAERYPPDPVVPTPEEKPPEKRPVARSLD